MSGKRNTGINVGGSSILVIFVLLCLTTFATLSMVSANADYKLTLKNAQAATSYYAADAKAEQILSEIDAAFQSRPLATTVSDKVQALGIEGIQYREDGVAGNPLISYAVPINELQSLEVELRLSVILKDFEANSEGRYTIDRWEYVITQWKVVNTAPLMEEEEPLEGLWSGEIIFLG